jgi:hypothetical protein
MPACTPISQASAATSPAAACGVGLVGFAIALGREAIGIFFDL